MSAPIDLHPEMRTKTGIYLLLSLVLLPFMPSSESLWIDEGLMLSVKEATNLHAAWKIISSASGSEAQMPLASLYYWMAGRFFGWSEWALRFSNLFPLALGVCALSTCGRLIGAAYLPLFLTVNPFVWFYANEIRPYSLQLASGCGLVLGLTLLSVYRQLNLHVVVVLGIAGLIATSASMLGLFAFGGAVLAATLITLLFRIRPTRGAIMSTLVFLVLFLLLGGYFGWTMTQGSGGYRGHSVNIANVTFAFYEMTGFSGLGPGRTALREVGRHGDSGILQTLLPHFPYLGALAGAWLATTALAFRGMLDSFRIPVRPPALTAWACWIAFLSALSMFTLVAGMVGFPFWGRHLTPTLPLGISAVAFSITCLASHRLRSCALFAVHLLIAILLISSFRQRFLSEYRKDDYRSAVAYANQVASEGKIVWWAAAPKTADYYSLRPTVIRTIAPESSSELPVETADCIIISKADLFDPHGILRKHINHKKYREAAKLPAFTIYIRDSTR